MFKMRDNALLQRYSSVCNVLRLWRIWLIPTYKSTYSMIRTLYYTLDYLLDYLLMVVMFFAKSVYSNSDRQTYTFLNVFSYLHHIYIYRIFHNEFWKRF